MVFKVLVFMVFLEFLFFCINFALKPLFFIIILFSVSMNLHSL